MIITSEKLQFSSGNVFFLRHPLATSHLQSVFIAQSNNGVLTRPASSFVVFVVSDKDPRGRSRGASAPGLHF